MDKSLAQIDEVAVGEALILRNLNFHPGRHVLVPKSIPHLKELLRVILAHPDMSFEIQGHICCRAPEPADLDGLDVDTGEYSLSHNRALNIYNYLVRNGVESSRLTYRGYGFSQPMILPETNDQERQMNRRVVIKVTDRAKLQN